MRTQISTNVSQETRNQADQLMSECGYSLRDVVTIAIEKLYTEKLTNREEETMPVEISGDRYAVCDQIWEQFVGPNTPEEFMSGHDNIAEAVSAYVRAIPEMFGEQPPVFYWREMNAEYTVDELLTRYLEDNLDN